MKVKKLFIMLFLFLFLGVTLQAEAEGVRKKKSRKTIPPHDGKDTVSAVIKHKNAILKTSPQKKSEEKGEEKDEKKIRD